METRIVETESVTQINKTDSSKKERDSLSLPPSPRARARPGPNGRWRARVWSPGVPSTPLKHAFDLFSKDKERQMYKNPFLLLSKIHVGQSGRERRKEVKKERKLVAITSNMIF